MRTLRLSLAGTVILMLLGGLAGVVMGEDEDALVSENPHQVSGTCSYTGHHTIGASVEEVGRTGRRGDLVRVVCEMDETGLSGRLWLLSNMDAIGGGNPCLRGRGLHRDCRTRQ